MKTGKQHPFRNKGKEGGFTLLEVLTAIVILTVALLGMAALVVGIIHGNAYSNDLTTATTLAQDKMEAVRGLGYSEIGAIGDEEDENPVTGYPQFRRVTSIEGVGSSPHFGLKAVTVTVSWDSERQPVVLKTILSQ